LTADQLGSPRVITDKMGNVISRRDFMPFGEALNAGVGSRNEALKYEDSSADNVRQRFTGYQKDAETDLDFAEARMYQNKHGRLTAVDPLMASADMGNPQTFNGYVYTGNNPINLTDPSGLNWCRNTSTGTPRWSGQNVACNGKTEEDITGKSREVATPGHIGNQYAGVGDSVTFNSDGSVTVHRSTAPHQAAVRNGQRVQSAAGGGTPAGHPDQVGSGSSHDTGTSELPSKDPIIIDGLQPCPVETCGSISSSNPQELDMSNVQEPDSVKAVKEIAKLLQMVPVVGEAATVIVVTIDLGEGNVGDAAWDGVGLIPFGSGLSRFGKVAHAAEEVTETGAKIKYIGRMEDLKDIPLSQTLLEDLPNLGSPKANYYQNSSVLRKALRDGYEIRDASAFRPNSELAPTLERPDRTIGQTFLGAERLILKNRGLWP
jgi:RHS repeat-associated protein